MHCAYAQCRDRESIEFPGKALVRILLAFDVALAFNPTLSSVRSLMSNPPLSSLSAVAVSGRSPLRLSHPSAAAQEVGLLRRSILTNMTAGCLGMLTFRALPSSASTPKDLQWPASTLDVSKFPYVLSNSERKTIRREVGPRIWAFDQNIGIYYVQVPIRMTVIAMDTGGLFVYAPVAPTGECLALLQPLIDSHGPVKYIVLPSVAVEHKVVAGAFARLFPSAEFYATDKQYSFPVPQLSFRDGLPRWTKPLPTSSRDSSMWGGEFEHEVLEVKPGPGSEYQDATFFHKPSKTLLLCDALYATDGEPPPILTSTPTLTRALLFHARDSPDELVEDTPEARRKGWRRIILLANFFFPGGAKVDLGLGPIATALKNINYPLGWGGWLPFNWREGMDVKAFEAYSAKGKPTIFSIIQIILARGDSGQATQRWVDKVKQWNFERVIPAHLDAPLAIGPSQFAETFDFIRSGRNQVRFCDEDVAFLRKAEETVLSFSVFRSKLGPLRGNFCGLI